MLVALAITPNQQTCYEGYTPPVVHQEEYKTEYHEVIKKQPSDLGYNCWAYAHSKSELPQGLYTLQDKLSKITTKTPRVGKVGVTAEGGIGHLVVVEKIEPDGILISEGNYIHGFISWRKLPPEKILGYF